MQSIALGYISRNGMPWLGRLLPRMAPAFDGIVAVDAGSADGTVELLRRHGATVVSRPWTDNYAEARNACIDLARSCGFHHLWMLDCDEGVLAQDVQYVAETVPDGTVVGFPRYNLCGVEMRRWRPDLYPDTQWRLFPLTPDVRYDGQLHEALKKGGVLANQIGQISTVHIFHYGYCQPAQQVWLRHHNYERLKQGLPVLADLPAGAPPYSEICATAIPFKLPHPLS